MARLKAKLRYALAAALHLATRYDGGANTKLKAIAAETGIPDNYLVHILIQLKQAALVSSRRGSKGGYRLSRPPERITLAQVLDAVQPIRPEQGAGDTEYDRLVDDLWARAERERLHYLASTTLADALATSPG
jgi:Rrf2 family protein